MPGPMKKGGKFTRRPAGDFVHRHAVTIPATIVFLMKLIKEIPGEVIKIKGEALDKIHLIGRIVKVEDQRNKTLITLDDCTGLLDIYSFKGGDEEITPPLVGYKFPNNHYFNLYCSIKLAQSGARYIIAEGITRVRDHNEVTNHLIATTYTVATTIGESSGMNKEDPNNPQPGFEKEEYFNQEEYDFDEEL